MEAGITIPHQDNGCARIVGHTYSKQGAVLALGALDQASRFSLPDRQGGRPYSARKQLQKTDFCPSAFQKNVGVNLGGVN